MIIKTNLVISKINLLYLKNLLSRRFSGFWLMVFIFAQNLVIFHNHYFRDFGFPWDFIQGYYTMVAFWTSIVSQGVYPSWIPFDSMGIPFNLMLQSGIHYPIFWLFPILKIEYTLHAAVVFQCLHVLFGAIGMFFFLKLIFRTKQYAGVYALLGAFVFQFFGGFYSNAEHPDIIRAFSFSPWLFYLFFIPNAQSRATWRYLFIPLIILFFATGAYPGVFISGIAVVGLYTLFQLVDHWMRGEEIRMLIYVSSILLVMTILGFGLSIFHLGPPWQFKEYLYRNEQIGNFNFASLGMEQLPALFLDNTVVQGEVSMTSTYLTLPALILLSYVPLRVIKRNWPMAGILGFSLLMVAGPKSVFWFILTKVVKPLQYSRFPSSDYRVFIAIALIYFAIFAINSLIERGITWKSFLFRTVIVLLWFSEGIYISYPVLRVHPVYKALAVCFIVIVVLAVYLFMLKKYRHKLVILMISLFILISYDALRVLPNLALQLPDGSSISTWGMGYPSFSEAYQRNQWPLMEDAHLLTYKIIHNLPSRRPARIEAENTSYQAEGYITGRYVFFYSPILASANQIKDQPKYKKFMLQEWTPLFFDDQLFKIDNDNFQIPPKLILATSTDGNSNMVRQTLYGINQINYTVSLNEPLLMVENEIYFPGWSATLASDRGMTTIQSVSVNNLFRAWLLPAGSYKMVARFEFPFSRFYNGASIIALLFWILLAYYFMKQKAN